MFCYRKVSILGHWGISQATKRFGSSLIPPSITEVPKHHMHAHLLPNCNWQFFYRNLWVCRHNCFKFIWDYQTHTQRKENIAGRRGEEEHGKYEFVKKKKEEIKEKQQFSILSTENKFSFSISNWCEII